MLSFSLSLALSFFLSFSLPPSLPPSRPSRRTLLPLLSRDSTPSPSPSLLFPLGCAALLSSSSSSSSRFTVPPLARTGLRAATKLACRRSRGHPSYGGAATTPCLSSRDPPPTATKLPHARIHSPWRGAREKTSRCVYGFDGCTDETTTTTTTTRAEHRSTTARGESLRTSHYVLLARSRPNWLEPLFPLASRTRIIVDKATPLPIRLFARTWFASPLNSNNCRQGSHSIPHIAPV